MEWTTISHKREKKKKVARVIIVVASILMTMVGGVSQCHGGMGKEKPLRRR